MLSVAVFWVRESDGKLPDKPILTAQVDVLPDDQLKLVEAKFKCGDKAKRHACETAHFAKRIALRFRWAHATVYGFELRSSTGTAHFLKHGAGKALGARSPAEPVSTIFEKYKKAQDKIKELEAELKNLKGAAVSPSG